MIQQQGFEKEHSVSLYTYPEGVIGASNSHPCTHYRSTVAQLQIYSNQVPSLSAFWFSWVKGYPLHYFSFLH